MVPPRQKNVVGMNWAAAAAAGEPSQAAEAVTTRARGFGPALSNGRDRPRLHAPEKCRR
jgi:hypothetical protein